MPVISQSTQCHEESSGNIDMAQITAAQQVIGGVPAQSESVTRRAKSAEQRNSND